MPNEEKTLNEKLDTIISLLEKVVGKEKGQDGKGVDGGHGWNKMQFVPTNPSQGHMCCNNCPVCGYRS